MIKPGYGIFIITLLFSVNTASAEVRTHRADIAVNEQLGRQIPADALFFDENGRKINLRDAIDKPSIIAPVYLGCMHVCPMLLTGLADALGKLETVEPGKDFQVIALSFDEMDTPTVARDKKKNYLKAIGKPFPEEEWKFLTGDAEAIKRFTESVGYRFQRDEHGFSHPVTLIVLAPGGKIVRYLYGTTFLPFDVTMAITEAQEGKVVSTTRKVLRYCFSYDPLEQTYVFNILKVLGTVIIVFVGAFFLYLMISTRKKRGET